MLFDTHCHLFDEQFADDVEATIDRAREAGVRYMVVPAVDVASARRAIALAERYEEIYAAVGIHPESLKALSESAFTEVEALASHPKVVAIGEIGLDYYWNVAPREVQKEVFLRQIDIARRVNLPIIIHNRDATEDTVEIIEHHCSGVTGVMHCFTGSIETARRCMKQGFYISYGGPVTFKKAENVRRAALEIPDEFLLVETDSPYLSPHPFRGKRNEPARVSLMVEKLAELRGQTFEAVAQYTLQNGRKLFYKIG
ncbi:TatD family hydrolase [Alicyclobacillus pomorum]|jgi:TatD DNase family protein|uniref:TatD family hydrolase n=1 Tax=Alicyclobacillus pomorum TaxID=204470 RepID=UPI000415B3C4|nr:TatD family hydrolase [Alicyclobacillus pomorum]